jgi:hypothetical protein
MASEGSTPPISPDGRFWWDGSQWQPLFTADGRFRWNGHEWTAVEAPLAAAAPGAAGAVVAPAPEKPAWLAEGQALPNSPAAAAVTPPSAAQAAAAPAAAAAGPVDQGAPAWQVPIRQSSFGISISQPMMAFIAFGLLAVMFVGVYGYNQVFVHQDPGDDVLVAKNIQLAYKTGDVERFHDQQKQTARLTLPAGQSIDTFADVDAVEDWRVIQVAADGTATVGLKFEALSGQFDGVDLTFNVKNAKEMQATISPDGRIVAGGTNGTAGGKATNSVPGSDQYFSVLPDHDVHVGDTWGSDWVRDNPLGSGKVHYRTTNKFLRYEYLSDGRAAVIDTVATLPIDESLNLKVLDQLVGADDPSTPAGASVVYKGNADEHVISYVNLESRQVEKSAIVSNFDFDMTFQGLPNTKEYQVLAGKFHFAGNQDADLTWLAPATSSPSPVTR